MTDYTRAVYDYLRTLGGVHEVVPTAIHPFLIRKFDLTPAEARRVRARVMCDLRAREMAERLNTRGRYVEILAEYYPDPWRDPGGKVVEDGLRRVD